MKDIKGFTLVELLAVITILGVLGLIAVQSIESVNKNNKEKAESAQRKSILSAAIAYVPTSDVILPTGNGDGLCVTLQYKPTNVPYGEYPSVCEVQIYLNYLVKEGILESDLENPVNGKKINMNNSYVKILYIKDIEEANNILDDSTIDNGQFDGNYFYQLVDRY